MKFASRVSVYSFGGKYFVYKTSAADAARVCASRQARRMAKDRIELTTGEADHDRDRMIRESFSALTGPRLDIPPRKNMGGHHTAPNYDRKTIPQAWYGAHSGQIGSLRHVFLRASEHGA